jgi:hypothetical protein
VNSSYPPSPYLNAVRLPARLNVAQTAAILGFTPYDIPKLVSAEKLQPLGNGARNCVKYFAAVEIEKLSRDMKWLDQATAAISRREKNVAEGHSTPGRQPVSHISAYAS